jgi:hypothetical protein
MADIPKRDEKKNNVRKLNPTESDVERDPQERAINPLAVRPEGVKVTLTKRNKQLDKMAKIFGF